MLTDLNHDVLQEDLAECFVPVAQDDHDRLIPSPY